MTKDKSESAQSKFELGKLYYEKTDFKKSIVELKQAADSFFEIKDYSQFLECQKLLLRMYAEMQDFAAINQTKEKLQDLVLNENFELNAETYYSLGLCASYKGQYDTSLEYLEKALALALSQDDKRNICMAINGLSIVYYNLGRLDEALKEIYNLQVFFQVMELPEIRLSSLIHNANILRELGKFEQALDLYWQCYDLLKDQKNLYTYVTLLLHMGWTYSESGQPDMARMYLKLAQKSIDPENLKYLSQILETKLNELGGKDNSQFDLVFDAASNAVFERKKGRVDFKNQFILLDMLRLFLKHPGEVYSKESLVKRVWKQEYDPAVHDNKIYVTIKRLRKMIEPDYDKPKYIYRAKNGYYLNKNTKVLFESTH